MCCQMIICVVLKSMQDQVASLEEHLLACMFTDDQNINIILFSKGNMQSTLYVLASLTSLVSFQTILVNS